VFALFVNYCIVSSIGSVIVKCSQTGEHYCAKLHNLTTEDALPVSKDDLYEGSSLMLEKDRKVFPVQFIKFKGLKFVTCDHCISVDNQTKPTTIMCIVSCVCVL